MTDHHQQISDLREELDAANAEIARLQAAREMMQLDAEKYRDEASKLRAEIRRLQTACERMMIGGNHIATYRTERWPDYGSEPMDVLEKLGAGQEYDMWCCWNAIMCARDTLKDPTP